MPDLDISNMYDIADLFRDFSFNFKTISPCVYIIVGIAFGSYVALKIKNLFSGGD